MKITFKKVDDFTWEATACGHTAEIRHEYFGLSDSYDLYINEKRQWSYDKLNEARAAGRKELEERISRS